MIKKVTQKYVKSLEWKPEPHTIGFDNVGDWYMYYVDGHPAGTLCVTDKNRCKYICSCYTHPDYRRRGILLSLIKYVCIIYSGSPITAHCLKSSKRVFEKAGFEHYNTVYWKHGTQYYMRKEA